MTEEKEIYEKTEKEQMIHADMLSICNFICKKYGLNPILSGSALLGLTRDGDLVPWSMGAILIVDSDAAIKKQYKILSELEKYKFTIKRHFKKRGNWKIRADKGKFNIEIFGYYVSRKQDVYIRKTGSRLKTIPGKFFDSLKTITLRGEKYQAPADVENYLTHLYGDWRTPIKSKIGGAGTYRSPSHCVKI